MKSKNITTSTSIVFTGNATEAEDILKRRGEAILNYQRIGAGAVLGICGNLSAIAESGAYALYNYSGIGEYAEKVFELKKSNASNYVKVGRVFLQADANDDTKFTCKLESVSGCPWNATQLLELTRLGKKDDEILETAKALVDGGIVLSTMSCADIRKACQKFLAGPVNEEARENEEAEENEATGESTETKAENKKTDSEKAIDKSEFIQKLAKIADNVNVITNKLSKKAKKEIELEYKEIFEILKSLLDEENQ